MFDMQTKLLLCVWLIFLLMHSACGQRKTEQNQKTTISTTNMKKQVAKDKKDYNVLTDEEKRVILYKGTEYPFTGKYYKHKAKGTYICKQCNAPLYRSEHKFDSHCGWPSFDDEIKGAVKRIPDPDGERTEIICNNCGGHLGHVFEGEGFTPKNIRHCVNSISIDFIPDEE